MDPSDAPDTSSSPRDSSPRDSSPSECPLEFADMLPPTRAGVILSDQPENVFDQQVSKCVINRADVLCFDAREVSLEDAVRWMKRFEAKVQRQGEVEFPYMPHLVMVVGTDIPEEELARYIEQTDFHWIRTDDIQTAPDTLYRKVLQNSLDSLLNGTLPPLEVSGIPEKDLVDPEEFVCEVFKPLWQERLKNLEN